jgi:HEAT repeat protein
VLGQLGLPVRTFPEESAAALERLAAGERDPEVLAAVAHAFGNLGEPHGLEALLALRAHPDARVRDGVATALAGRQDPRAIAALIELTGDADPEVRDWATFALGTLAAQDTPELRDALAGRLADEDADTRVEAVHGLAMRGDLRAAEPALELLAEAARGEAGRTTVWKQHALRAAAERLAQMTGDERFSAYAEQLGTPRPAQPA